MNMYVKYVEFNMKLNYPNVIRLLFIVTTINEKKQKLRFSL